MQYKNLFSEGRIGKVVIKNRVVMPPLEVGMANYDGTPSEQIINYLEARAKGGAGLIISEFTRVNDLHGAAHPRQLALSRDRHVEPMKKLVDRIHKHDAKFFFQLHHPGRQNLSLMVLSWPMLQLTGKIVPGFWKIFPYMIPATEWCYENVWAPAVVAPSAVPCNYSNQKTRALKNSEIKSLVNDFINGAIRAKKCGADGVELHAAHGYLIQQFLSTRTNKRTDEYGGSLENRMRFLLEMIAGIKRECGADFPVIVRLAVDEYYRCIGETDCGIELTEGIEMARRLEKAGVDAIDVSSATYETMNYWLEPTTFATGWRKNLAQAVKDSVNIPVIAANLIRSPEQAEDQLVQGVQDFVALGRPYLADPEWASKSFAGKTADIKRCINCLWCFESLNINARKGLPLECAVNPRLGRERETAQAVKNGNGRIVAVVGAGPAGLMAAQTLAEKGFKVEVFEKNAFVGGQLQLANKPPKKEKIGWCFTDLENAAKKNGAVFHFETEVTPDTIAKLNPYAVIVATGGSAVKPPIPGGDQSHVCTVTEILNGSVKVNGKKIAVIGSGMTGLETAEKLAEDGNSILIVEMLEKIGPDAYQQNFDDIMSRLKDYKPEFIAGHKLVRIKPDAVVLENVLNGQKIERQVQQVVLAVGVRPDNALAKALEKSTARVFIIGDASKIGRIVDATRAGFDVAWNME